ncbi:hypothetical protein [Arenibacter echinorum]|uniref:Ferric reductase like protein n=1 Tax=Arenibacter echinorum TaxID=440515 RepID=A0A327RJT0_9FLAO|nr:hypothetical protein [Arenibacter echinorum]RAJ13967.1 hypothetical protein LV92_01083 [Arenibacter echinorum]
MNKSVHTVYIFTMVTITVLVTVYLFYTGYTYYGTPLEERFYHPRHNWFKPSGIYGQGLGIIGTFLIVFGVSIYIARKRYNFLAKYIRLKYLLEFHIFLCTLGPILVLFHTAFKFGGIVSVAFWSMVAVVLSGVVGRFIYNQIPKTIEGRQLTMNEVKSMQTDLAVVIHQKFHLESNTLDIISDLMKEENTLDSGKKMGYLRKVLNRGDLPKEDRKGILKIVKQEISLSKKIKRLERMQQLFKYWHVVHMPFAIIMLVIVVIHVAVTLAFGYRWIF